jgi:hypothetical protein
MSRYLEEAASRSRPARFFEWDSLLGLRSTPLSAVGIYATLLIPILVLSANLFNNLSGADPTELPISLPVSVFVAYGSALLFSLASILVDVRCPSDIKEHRRFRAYLDHISEVAGKVSAAQSKLTRALEQQQRLEGKEETLERAIVIDDREILERFTNKLFAAAAGVSLADSYAKMISEAPKVWAELLVKHPVSRFVIGAIYIISLLASGILFFIKLPIEAMALVKL